MVKFLLEIEGIDDNGVVTETVFRKGADIIVEFGRPVKKVKVKTWVKEE